jgi:hypothetical protein
VLRGGALQVGCILRANFGPLGLISFPISPTRSYDEAGRWRSEMLRWEHSSRRTTRKEHRRMVDVLAVRRRSRRGSPLCRVFWVIFAGEHRLTRPLSPCCDAQTVVLDPLPRMPADGLLGLVALDRRRFVEWFTGRDQGPMLPNAV